jgi:hypothetical protein|tara:strand:- start:4185 stop:5120 length:936 start_codon:yes stop_codon:yes gene_type:complete
MKFLVIKSYSGFGDRVEHLLACFKYAVKTQRYMVIDWSDHVWCGNEMNKSFDYYFYLKNVNYMPINDFKKIFIKNKLNNTKMSVMPTFFEDIMLKRSDENDVKYKFGDIAQLFREVISDKRKDIEVDILVTTDLDKRNNMGIVSIPNLVYKKVILDFIKEEPNYNFLMNNKFVTIHLRGSDRSKYTEENRPDLTNYSHHKEKYVDNLISQIPKGTENLLVLTDSTILYDLFMEKIDSKYNVLETNNVRTSGNVGLHLEREESKESKNLELLKDFYFMTRSSYVVCDKISRFSLVAYRVCELGKPRETQLKT